MKEEIQFKIYIKNKNISKEFEISKDICLIGRGSKVDIELDHEQISRNHIKISKIKDQIYVEELGSSNGSWLDGNKLEVGKKVLYTNNSILFLGSLQGVNILIENKSWAINSDNEKTLMFDLKSLKNESIVNSNTTLKVSNGPNIIINQTLPKKEMKLVPPIENKKDNDNDQEIKVKLENQVKSLIHKEAEKLREESQKVADEILRHAKEQDIKIKDQAKKESLEIIKHAQDESTKIIYTAERESNQRIEIAKQNISDYENSLKKELDTLNEKIELQENELEKATVKLNNYKKSEQAFLNKLEKQNKELNEIQIKKEKEIYSLEEVQSEIKSFKKLSEQKTEDMEFEERRHRAKLDIELIESQSQIARMIAEAQQAHIQWEMLSPELENLKVNKANLDMQILDQEIALKRAEYEIERANKDLNHLRQEMDDEQKQFADFQLDIKVQKEQITQLQTSLASRELILQENEDAAISSSDKLIKNAEAKAQEIIEYAHKDANIIQIQREQSLKEIEEFKKKTKDELEKAKSKYLLEIESEKNIKYSKLNEEISQAKIKLLAELNLLEKSKLELKEEMNWQKKTAVEKNEKLINDAKQEADAIKAIAEKDRATKFELLLQELSSMKKKTLNDIAELHKKSEIELSNQKKIALLEIETSKKNNEKNIAIELEKSSEQIKLKHGQIQATQEKLSLKLEENEGISRSLENEISKAQSLMDIKSLNTKQEIKDSLDQASQEAKLIIEQARQEAVRTERSIKSKLENEQIEFNQLKQAEIEKISQAKTRIRLAVADQVGVVVEEYLNQELIKSRNFPITEKLVIKIAEKSKFMIKDNILKFVEQDPSSNNPTVKATPDIENKILKYLIYFVSGSIVIISAIFIYGISVK